MSYPAIEFGEFLQPNSRPYLLGPTEDANLVGMRLYGQGPFHRELKTASKIQKKSHFVIREGDVIYNKLFAWRGTFGVVPSPLDGMFVSDKFPTYQLDTSRADRDYVRWYFRYQPLWDQARELSTGSAAISKLTLNPPRFLKLLIPLPPLAEQRRIVAKIDQLATKIDEALATRNASLAARRGIVSAAVESITKETGCNGMLGQVLMESPRNGWSARCDNASDGTPVLSLAAINGFRYRPDEHKRTSLVTRDGAHYWLKPGDLLMSRSNTPELVGHAALYDGRPSPCIYPDLMMRLRVNERLSATRFVWYWLQSPVVRKYVVANARGTSPTMKKIDQGTVMRIPFPTQLMHGEQLRIVANLDDLQAQLDPLWKLQGQTAAELDALLPSILDRAFKGEL